MRLLLVALATGLSIAAHAQDGAHPSAPAAQRMRIAALAVLEALPAELRAQASRGFDDADRFDWHYTPRSRGGVSFKEMDATARRAVHALLTQALSAAGHRKIVGIIELETVLRELETFGLMRDPEKYHLTIYGRPDARAAWGWRFEGHHLSLNFTLAGERLAVDTPSFLGANPARVPKGPKAGLRVLAAEEDEARALLEMLTPAQRSVAVYQSRTYGEIVTGASASVSPEAPVGIAAAQLDARQQAQLLKLIETYAATFEPGLARARLERVHAGGLAAVHFGWAGSTRRGEPHYYRVQGPLFLIEYDSSQNSGNHIHTVWRDFSGDFGRDLLREHYRSAPGAGHRH